jgi:hypothetical protein
MSIADLVEVDLAHIHAATTDLTPTQYAQILLLFYSELATACTPGQWPKTSTRSVAFCTSGPRTGSLSLNGNRQNGAPSQTTHLQSRVDAALIAQFRKK